LSVCVCTEFKASRKILNMLCDGVSDFVLIAKDALQSGFLTLCYNTIVGACIQ